jgi:thymidylate synthase
MSKVDKTYHKLLESILSNGYKYNDPNRAGVKRLEILGSKFRHEFKDGFPAITTKKLFYKNVVTELIWFLRGDTNIKYLLDNGCNIWNKDAYKHYLKLCKEYIVEDPYTINEFVDLIKSGKGMGGYSCGDLGPVYGHQWRNFGGVDQISKLINGLRYKPMSTEHIVNSWNVGQLDDMALPPCHYVFQVLVKPLSRAEMILHGTAPIDEDTNRVMFEKSTKYGFELHWDQRSVDVFLGLPYNIASYATLAKIIEKLTGYKALAIQGDLKNVHLYDNSLEAVKLQLSRSVDQYDKCELKFNNYSYNEGTDWTNKSMDDLLDDLVPEDFELVDYKSYDHIAVPMLERNN